MKLKNGRYSIQGRDVLSLCERYQTPLYIYDGDRMRKQYSRLLSAFDVPKLRIYYACKALSNLNVLNLFREAGAGLDTVSIGEVRLGLQAGFDKKDILYTPNMVSREEMEAAIHRGVRINIGNLDMLEYFGLNFSGYPVCIRINPHILAGGHRNTSVGHIDSKFGISIHQLPRAHRLVSTLDIDVEGIHMHNGSDILDPEVFITGADILFKAALDFDDLEYIDFGSGFKVKYKMDDFETDIEQIGRRMSERFHQFTGQYGKTIELAFEPGKYLVSEAGYFFAPVNVVKQTTSTVFAGIDTGFNHFIRPMFYDAYHEIINISNPDGEQKMYSVVGYICETDTFGANRILNEVEPNHVLCINNAGAYGFVMSSNYNSRPRPAEVLVENGSDRLIREHETFDDLQRKVKF